MQFVHGTKAPSWGGKQELKSSFLFDCQVGCPQRNTSFSFSKGIIWTISDPVRSTRSSPLRRVTDLWKSEGTLVSIMKVSFQIPKSSKMLCPLPLFGKDQMSPDVERPEISWHLSECFRKGAYNKINKDLIDQANKFCLIIYPRLWNDFMVRKMH